MSCIGFGQFLVLGRSLVPRPPAIITAGLDINLFPESASEMSNLVTLPDLLSTGTCLINLLRMISNAFK